MPTYRACLVDVFDTVLSVDWPDYTSSLADTAGVDGEAFTAAVGLWSRSVMDGSASVAQALAEALRRCGTDADERAVERLVAADRALIHQLAVLHDDAVPFLESLRAKGVRTAFVSNCADNTRPLLDALQLSDLVDELVLSCEVGAAKPDPAIFETALERLGVRAEEALFVDDQQGFCDGAAALGIRAVLIDRFNGSGDVSTLGELAECFA